VLLCHVASIIRVNALMMEAATTSETSVNLYHTTWCNNPEDSHLHIPICFLLTDGFVVLYRILLCSLSDDQVIMTASEDSLQKLLHQSSKTASTYNLSLQLKQKY
jgi:hypothetical protein